MLSLTTRVQSHNTGRIVYTRDQLIIWSPGEEPSIPGWLRGDAMAADLGPMSGRGRAVIEGNIRLLANNMDALEALTWSQGENRESSIMRSAWSDTRLHPDSPWLAHGPSRQRNHCQVLKKKEGGLAFFINNRWCQPGHITMKECVWSSRHRASCHLFTFLHPGTWKRCVRSATP